MAGGHLLVGGVGTAIGVALMAGLTHNGPVWLPALVLGGVGFAAMWVAYGYVLQRETPPDLMGRVAATATGLYMLPGLVGPPLGATLAGRFGVGWVFAVASAALMVLGLVVLAAQPRASSAPPGAFDATAQPPGMGAILTEVADDVVGTAGSRVSER